MAYVELKLKRDFPYFSKNLKQLFLPAFFIKNENIDLSKRIKAYFDIENKKIAFKCSEEGFRKIKSGNIIYVSTTALVKTLNIKKTPEYIGMEEDMIVFSYEGCD